MSTEPQRSSPVHDIVRMLRVNHWTKNAVVLAAFFFAFWDRSQHLQARAGLLLALAATGLFCLVSSAVYILNDLADLAADRAHPLKKFRPIASGRIPVPVAWGTSLLLLGAGLPLAWILSRDFGKVLTVYVLIQGLYSVWLKRVALVDVFVIASGFVLRAIAGAVVLHVHISPWLLLCTFLLALFLALCKRRHEKVLMSEISTESRPSLEEYDRQLLDHLIAITAAATIVCYAVYTMSAETISKFGTSRLGFSVPFVVFGIFRYMDLVYRHEKGDRPEHILLSDGPILVDLALYVLTLVAVFAMQRW